MTSDNPSNDGPDNVVSVDFREPDSVQAVLGFISDMAGEGIADIAVVIVPKTGDLVHTSHYSEEGNLIALRDGVGSLHHRMYVEDTD